MLFNRILAFSSGPRCPWTLRSEPDSIEVPPFRSRSRGPGCWWTRKRAYVPGTRSRRASVRLRIQLLSVKPNHYSSQVRPDERGAPRGRMRLRAGVGIWQESIREKDLFVPAIGYAYLYVLAEEWRTLSFLRLGTADLQRKTRGFKTSRTAASCTP